MSRALPYCVAAPVALLVSLVAAQAHALTPLLPSGPPTLGTGPTPSPSVAPSAPAETNADVRTGTAPEQHFGDAGTRALALSFDYGQANAGLPTQPLAFGVRPSLDAFVLPGLSFGATVGFDVASQPGYNGTIYTVGGGPRVGYALRLGDSFILWPKVFLSFDSGSVPTVSSPPGATSLAFNANGASLEDLRVGVHVPFALKLGAHTLFEVGPVLSRDLWRTVGGQQVAAVDLVQLRCGLVGWF